MSESPKPPDPEHAERVDGAFDDLHQSLAGPLSPEAHESLSSVREAARDRDAERLREHLAEVKERHGWLYRELTEHPGVTALINELSIWGF